MKLEKKHWIIIGIVVAIILVWYFFLRKKTEKAESNYRMIRRNRRPTPIYTNVVSNVDVMPVPVFKKALDFTSTSVASVVAKTPSCPTNPPHTFLPCCGCVPDSELKPTATATA
jgi:hypothetical protein